INTDSESSRAAWNLIFLSVIICGPISSVLAHHAPSLISISPVLNCFALCLRPIRRPLPHNPDVVRACAGRSLLFGEIRVRETRGFVPGPSGLAAPETLRKGRDTEENRFSG